MKDDNHIYLCTVAHLWNKLNERDDRSDIGWRVDISSNNTPSTNIRTPLLEDREGVSVNIRGANNWKKKWWRFKSRKIFWKFSRFLWFLSFFFKIFGNFSQMFKNLLKNWQRFFSSYFPLVFSTLRCLGTHFTLLQEVTYRCTVLQQVQQALVTWTCNMKCDWLIQLPPWW